MCRRRWARSAAPPSAIDAQYRRGVADVERFDEQIGRVSPGACSGGAVGRPGARRALTRLGAGRSQVQILSPDALSENPVPAGLSGFQFSLQGPATASRYRSGYQPRFESGSRHEEGPVVRGPFVWILRPSYRAWYRCLHGDRQGGGRAVPVRRRPHPRARHARSGHRRSAASRADLTGPAGAQHVAVVDAVAPSAIADTNVMTFAPTLAAPGRSPKSTDSSTSASMPSRRASVAVNTIPASAPLNVTSRPAAADRWRLWAGVRPRRARAAPGRRRRRAP